MNDDVSKSFPCNEIGCQMNFYTEQNLSAHRQVKHNKLNLEIPPKDATINFSDQTPTPTRLLNKCEELRVFDDPYIQNLNPFDEGFRKAISDDHQPSGFLMAPSSNQDTLHTPQILPDYLPLVVKEEKAKSEDVLPMQDEPENLSTTPDIPKYSTSEHDTGDRIHHSQPQQIHLLPKPNIIYAAPILTPAATMHLNDSGKSSESVKDKLKNIILNNNNISSTSTLSDGNKRIKMDTDTKLNLPTILIQTVPIITPANLIINNNNNIETSKLRIATSNDSNSNKKTNLKPLDVKKLERDTSTNNNKKRTATTNSDNSNHSNTKSDSAALKVERNRAAARRYRHKMKIQGQALRDKYEKSQKEIAQLKKEVLELKKLLLLHKDCEVTKSLNQMS